jgi:hypothetical protein
VVAVVKTTFNYITTDAGDELRARLTVSSVCELRSSQELRQQHRTQRMLFARVFAGLLLIATGVSAGPKRGLVSGSCNHSLLFNPPARGWHYNYNRQLVGGKKNGDPSWDTVPACEKLASGGDYEFVPMIASLYQLSSDPVQAGSARLLGMNEPSSAKNESAELAAKRWPEYEATAARFTPPLELGSAAPGGLNLKRGQEWLKDFFGNCSALYGTDGCRVNFVAVHFYECDGSTDATAEAAAQVGELRVPTTGSCWAVEPARHLVQPRRC